MTKVSTAPKFPSFKFTHNSSLRQIILEIYSPPTAFTLWFVSKMILFKILASMIVMGNAQSESVLFLPPPPGPKAGPSPTSSPTYLRSLPSNRPSNRPRNRTSVKPTVLSSGMRNKPSTKPSSPTYPKATLSTSPTFVYAFPSKKPSKQPIIRPTAKPTVPPSGVKKTTTSKPSNPILKPTRVPTYLKVKSPSIIPVVTSRKPSRKTMLPSKNLSKSKPPTRRRPTNKPVRTRPPSISTTNPLKQSSQPSFKVLLGTTQMPQVSSPKKTIGPTDVDFQDMGSNTTIPKFSLKLYVDTAKLGIPRKMQMITIDPFDDPRLVAIIQNCLFQGFSNEMSASFVSISQLSNALLVLNKTENSDTMWIASNYSGIVSFVGDMPSSNQLGEIVLRVFRSSASLDNFMLQLHSTNNMYLQLINGVDVKLILDSSSSNINGLAKDSHTSTLPFIVVGSVLSVITLTIIGYFAFKKKKKIRAEAKITPKTPCTPLHDVDMSPDANCESARHNLEKKNMSLLGIEAKDVYTNETIAAEDLISDSLSSICLSLNRIMEERGILKNDNEISLSLANTHANLAINDNLSTIEDSSSTLIPSSGPQHDEYDMRNCCALSPIENTVTDRLFNKASVKMKSGDWHLGNETNDLCQNITIATTNVEEIDRANETDHGYVAAMYPMYSELLMNDEHVTGNDYHQHNLNENNWALTPIPKPTFASFEMRNRSESITLDDIEKNPSADQHLSYISHEFPSPITGSDIAKKLADQFQCAGDVSQSMPPESIMSYDEYDMRNCCAFNPMDSDLKRRLFGKSDP